MGEGLREERRLRERAARLGLEVVTAAERDYWRSVERDHLLVVEERDHLARAVRSLRHEVSVLHWRDKGWWGRLRTRWFFLVARVKRRRPGG